MSYTHVSHNSFGGNIVRSIGAALFGLVLFVLAFPVLWWNEGRLDVSTVAKNALVLPPDGAGGKGDGELIAVTGGLASTEQVGDPDFLRPAAHVAVHRKVEMYAWVEKKSEHEEKQLGGSSRTVTTYDYVKEWTSTPKGEDDFAHPEGHENPPLPVESHDFFASKANVGVFGFDPSGIELPPATPLALEQGMLVSFTPPAPPPPPAPTVKGKVPPSKVPAKPSATPSASAKPRAAPRGSSSAAAPVASAKPDADDDADEPARGAGKAAKPRVPIAELTPHLAGGFVMLGDGTLEDPRIGDARVSFQVVDPTPGPVTLYGVRQGNGVAPWVEPGDKLLPAKLYRVVPGTHAEAVKLLHAEHTTLTWILRAIGIFMLWIGLSLVVAPLNAVLDVVPFIGSAGRTVTTLVMFPIALVLGSVTILLAIVAHNPILLLVPAVLLVGTFVLVGVLRRKKRAQQPQPAWAGAYGPQGYGPQQQGYGPQQGGPPQQGYGPPPPSGPPWGPR